MSSRPLHFSSYWLSFAFYAIPRRQTSNDRHEPSDLQSELCPLPLASLPLAGAKRKLAAASASPSSRSGNVSSAVVIEKTVGRPSEVAAPPSEYQFRVSPSDHELIVKGVKTLEIR